MNQRTYYLDFGEHYAQRGRGCRYLVSYHYDFKTWALADIIIIRYQDGTYAYDKNRFASPRCPPTAKDIDDLAWKTLQSDYQ